VFTLRKKPTAAAAATPTRHQQAVRYIGASGYRRFSAEKRNAGRSVAADTWLTIAATILAALALLGIWQESQSPQKEKPGRPATTAVTPASQR